MFQTSGWIYFVYIGKYRKCLSKIKCTNIIGVHDIFDVVMWFNFEYDSKIELV